MRLLRGHFLLVLLLLSAPAESVMASGPPPSSGLGGLQVTITNLPPNVRAGAAVTGPAPGGVTRQVPFTMTLPLQAGQYTISANPVRVLPVLERRPPGSTERTYFPTVTPATVTVQAGTTAQAVVDYLTIVPDTTKVLGSTVLRTLISASPDGVTLVFANSPALPPLAPGDVLVAGVSPQTPFGFLRKVTAVSVQGTQVVVTTGPATLFDAAPRGGFDVQATLTANDI